MASLKKKWFKNFILIGVLILSVFIFVIPYVIYIHQETGQWLISKKAVDNTKSIIKKECRGGRSIKRH